MKQSVMLFHNKSICKQFAPGSRVPRLPWKHVCLCAVGIVCVRSMGLNAHFAHQSNVKWNSVLREGLHISIAEVLFKKLLKQTSCAA